MILREMLFVPKDRVNHMLSCCKMANELISKNEILKSVEYDVLNLALYHDIGYSSILNKLNFHSLDGAIFLDDKLDKDVVKAVAFHGGAEHLAEKQNNKDNLLELFDTFKIDTCRSELFLDVINFIDAHVDGIGNWVSVKDRYKDIVNRYGVNSIQARTFWAVGNSLKSYKL